MVKRKAAETYLDCYTVIKPLETKKIHGISCVRINHQEEINLKETWFARGNGKLKANSIISCIGIQFSYRRRNKIPRTGFSHDS